MGGGGGGGGVWIYLTTDSLHITDNSHKLIDGLSTLKYLPWYHVKYQANTQVVLVPIVPTSQNYSHAYIFTHLQTENDNQIICPVAIAKRCSQSGLKS